MSSCARMESVELPMDEPRPQQRERLASCSLSAPAIIVRDARKCYSMSSTWVLDGLNMTVAEGSMYALLGSSGCGKTTILSCIVGRRRLNSGSIRVLGVDPTAPGSGLPGPSVGYMPQELGLYGGFSVSEILTFFGGVAGLQKDVIKERMKEFLKFLDIPDETKIFNSLSGGQRQRVSLAAVLLLRPPILILDEPTVGVDPVLRQNIWDMFMEVTREGMTTVIITTHYIEEARQADKVGLMRKGVLLAEDEPRALLSRFGCDSLEDVFLRLSLLQEGDIEKDPAWSGSVSHARETRERENDKDSAIKLRTSIRPKTHSNLVPCILRAVDFTKRNIPTFCFLLILPIICCVTYSLAIGRDPKSLHLAVVNEEFDCSGISRIGSSIGSNSSRTGFHFPPDCETGQLDGLSCLLLQAVDPAVIVQDAYDDVEKAKEAVARGHAWGVLHITPNFSQAVVDRYLLAKDAPDEVLDNSSVEMWLDLSDQVTSNYVRRYTMNAILSFYRKVQEGCSWNLAYKFLPMTWEEPVFGNADITFTESSAAAVILTNCFFLAVLGTAGNLLEDRHGGILERILSSGVGVVDLLCGHLIIQLVCSIATVAAVLITMLDVFGFGNMGSLFWVSLLCFLTSVSGIIFGFFIATLCKSEMAAFFLGMGSYFGIVFTNGMMWPLEGYHPLIRPLTPLVPLALPNEALRCMLARGWGIDHPAVYAGFFSSIGWVIVFTCMTLATIYVQRRIS